WHEGERDKARKLHTPLDFRIFHEETPHSLGAVVLDHNHDGPLIDAQLIRTVPIVSKVESVFKAVSRPDIRPQLGIDVAQSRQTVFGSERHRTAGCSRGEGAIIVLARWRAMGRVARGGVTRGQTPNVAGIS